MEYGDRSPLRGIHAGKCGTGVQWDTVHCYPVDFAAAAGTLLLYPAPGDSCRAHMIILLALENNTAYLMLKIWRCSKALPF